MYKYKKFTFLMIISLLITLIFHLIIWNYITKYVLLVNDNIYTGDLGRISLFANTAYPRQAYPSKKSVNLKKEHIEYKDWNSSTEKISMITIGDSFSNAATQGTNPFYQDYISTFNNINILNLHQISKAKNYIETIAILNNNGILDQIKPKYILIESVERFAINRFSIDVNLSITNNYNDVVYEMNNLINNYLSRDKQIKFVNDKNIKAFKNNILYNFDDNAFNSNVYKVKLKKDFFTSKEKNTLLYFHGDIKAIALATKENIKKLNDNFNKLAILLKEKGIKLYFMPAVDKYNLYEPYIINNTHPKSTFFEYLRKLPKEYTLIDTKDILSKELNKATKDLYYPDDTHWSYKASEAIFKKVKFE